MQKNIVSSLLVGAALVVGYAITAQADYQPLSRFPAEIPYVKNSKEVPLMVIRFNEPDVAYSEPLYETMTKAFQRKPSARFDIVSVSPKSPNKTMQRRYEQLTADNASKVMATFNEIGMPSDRLTLSSTSENVKASEVRIYVH